MDYMTIKYPWHDFKRKGSHFITLKLREGIQGRFVLVEGDRGLCKTSLGGIVEGQWERVMEEMDGAIRVEAFVLMPDHLHAVLTNISELPRPLGCYIGRFKSLATYHARRSLGYPTTGSLWEAAYGWRKITSSEELARAIAYVEDNPRVYLEKRQATASFGVVAPIDHPRLPKRWPDAPSDPWRLSWMALGKRSLLEGELWPLCVSRSVKPDELVQAKEEALLRARKGMTCLSPAISPGEKEVFRAILEAGGKAIQLSPDWMTPRYHPVGWAMEALKEGRLLVLSPIFEKPRNGKINSVLADHLNACAQEIAGR